MKKKVTLNMRPTIEQLREELVRAELSVKIAKDKIQQLREELVRAELSVKIAKDKIQKMLEKSPTYVPGMRFRRIPSKEVFLLAQVGYNDMVLVSLVNGNRWQKPTTVGDIHAITQNEFEDYAEEGWEFVGGKVS